MRGREGCEVQGEVNAVREPRLPWLVPGRYVHTYVFMYMCVNALLDISVLSWFPLISHVWLLHACVRVFVHHSSNLSHWLTAGVFTELCWVSLYTWAHLRLTETDAQQHSRHVAVIHTAPHTLDWIIQPFWILIPHATCSAPDLFHFSALLYQLLKTMRRKSWCACHWGIASWWVFQDHPRSHETAVTLKTLYNSL